MTDQVLNFDFDALTVAEIDFLEDELNSRLRDLLGDKIVTFNDVIDQFRPRAEGDRQPDLKIPQGKILRVMAWMQIRKSDPAATWEQAGELRLKMEVAPPKAEVMVVDAQMAATHPETEMQRLLTAAAAEPMMPPSPPTATDA